MVKTTSVSRAPTEPVARLVLLGASNLRLGLSTLLRAALARLGGPVEVFVAHGFGRSYNWKSSIPWRKLPGILPCGLWEDVRKRPSLPTFALVTDVGNDLLYGAGAQQLVDWATECIARLEQLEAQIVVTELPIESILATSNVRFQIFRTIFFPPSRLTLKTACDHAQRTNEGLIEVANRHGCKHLQMPSSWYGIDPIHIRRSCRRGAWQAVVDAWQEPGGDEEKCVFPCKNRYLLNTARPQERWLLGMHQTRTQPSLTLVDGSRVAIY